MFDAMLNGLKGLQTGGSGAATSGVFGAGGQNFLGGNGTALGPGTINEFGAMPTAGKGLADVFSKFDNMTPEQSLHIATQMAQFGAPPQMPQMQAPQIKAPQFSQFVQPQAQAIPQLRTPMGG